MKPLLSRLRALPQTIAALLLTVSTSLAYADNPVVMFETTKGDLTIELYPDQAPKTVANILDLVDTGFYDGLIFHRVLPNFVIQAGGYLPNMDSREEPRTVVNESNNGLKNDKYTLSMARLSDPDSAGAQFYINLKNNTHLNYRRGAPGYTVFGRVINGTDVAEEIGRSETTTKSGMPDVPVEAVIITKAHRR